MQSMPFSNAVGSHTEFQKDGEMSCLRRCLETLCTAGPPVVSKQCFLQRMRHDPLYLLGGSKSERIFPVLWATVKIFSVVS